MAIKYLKSTAVGTADGSSWVNAFTTLVNALAGVAAGDTIYVSQSHAETQATAISLTSPGTISAPVNVICANDGATPPTATATTATVTITGAAAFTFSAGFINIFGVAFILTNVSSSAFFVMTSVNAWSWLFDTCKFTFGTGATASITFGNAGSAAQKVELINTPISFGNAGQKIIITAARFVWRNTPSAVQTTAPTTLFTFAATKPSLLEVIGVDLSLMGSGKNIIDVSGAAIGRAIFENCKLGASVNLTTGTIASNSLFYDFVNCSSSTANYQQQKTHYYGTLTDNETVFLNSGAGPVGTNVSWKMVSSANTNFYGQLVSDPIEFWNDVLTSQTASVEVVTDGVTLTNADCWAEVEYLGAAGNPQSSIATCRVTDILTSTANQTSSAASWTTTGLVSPITQKLQVTFTAALKGIARLRVYLAKVSTTVYVNPQVGLATGKTYQTRAGGGYTNEASNILIIDSRRRVR